MANGSLEHEARTRQSHSKVQELIFTTSKLPLTLSL